jgi:hypothetical protein
MPAERETDRDQIGDPRIGAPDLWAKIVTNPLMRWTVGLYITLPIAAFLAVGAEMLIPTPGTVLVIFFMSDPPGDWVWLEAVLLDTALCEVLIVFLFFKTRSYLRGWRPKGVVDGT